MGSNIAGGFLLGPHKYIASITLDPRLYQLVQSTFLMEETKNVFL